MRSLRDILKEQQRARPRHFPNSTEDSLIALLIETAEEVCVLRDDIDTRRRLAEGGTLATDDAVRAFPISDEIVSERLASHQRFFEELFARLPD